MLRAACIGVPRISLERERNFVRAFTQKKIIASHQDFACAVGRFCLRAFRSALPPLLARLLRALRALYLVFGGKVIIQTETPGTLTHEFDALSILGKFKLIEWQFFRFDRL